MSLTLVSDPASDPVSDPVFDHSAPPLSAFPAAHNDSLLWGTYRPGLYFGLKSRTFPTLGAGIFWHGENGLDSLRHGQPPARPCRSAAPPLSLQQGVSIRTGRGCPQNDESLADGAGTSARSLTR